MNRSLQRSLAGRLTPSLCAAAALAVCLILPGCAAFHPIHGIPARYVPEEYRGFTRAGQRTIDLSLLKQTPAKAHLVDTGDVLGIYIEGVLGDRKLPQPVNIPLTNESPPSFGFPIPVRDDGTVSLPLVGSINVRGLTIGDVELRLKEAYTKHKQFLNPENDRILVSLQRSRMYRVLVIRQEAGALAQQVTPGMLNMGTLKRGTGQLVSLPAYKNDVLHALAQTGGLPGLDAENAIYIIRRRKSNTGWTPLPGTSLPNSPMPIPAEARRTPSERPVIRAQAANWGPGAVDLSTMSVIEPTGEFSMPTANPQLRSSMPVLNRRQDERREDVVPMQYQAWQPQASSPESFVPPPPAPSADPRAYAPPADSIPPRAWPPQPEFRSHPPLAQAVPAQPPRETTAYIPAPPNPAAVAVPQLPQTVAPEENVPAPHALPTMTAEEFGWDFSDGGMDGRRIIKIPVRLGPGETVDLQEQDVILEDGDIIFIETRDTEVFYTGGLLGGGQFTLPRDYDLNVLQAIAVSQAQRQGGGGGSRATMSIGGQSALNSDVSISGSSVVVLRYLPDGRMVPIEIDLYKARTDVAEQIIIQPGDYILLQYTKAEAIAAFFERHLLEGALFGVAGAQLVNGNGN